MSLNRKTVRIITGLLTGRCRINRLIKITWWKKYYVDPAIKNKTAEQMLFHCEDLGRHRFLQISTQKPTANSYTKD